MPCSFLFTFCSWWWGFGFHSIRFGVRHGMRVVGDVKGPVMASGVVLRTLFGGLKTVPTLFGICHSFIESRANHAIARSASAGHLSTSGPSQNLELVVRLMEACVTYLVRVPAENVYWAGSARHLLSGSCCGVGFLFLRLLALVVGRWGLRRL